MIAQVGGSHPTAFPLLCSPADKDRITILYKQKPKSAMSNVTMMNKRSICLYSLKLLATWIAVVLLERVKLTQVSHQYVLMAILCTTYVFIVPFKMY